MALQYGFNFTASDARQVLEQNDKQQSGVKSWRQLFSNASLGYQAQRDALTSSYSDAIAQAYKSNLEQKNTIMGAGLNVGATKDLLTQNRDNIHSAYQTYIQNYGKDITSAASSYANEVSSIDTALTERAENFVKLYNNAYKYLAEELYGSSKGDTNFLSTIGLDWVKDEDDAIKTWNDIAPQLFNDDRTLNAKGVEFFDQVFNAMPQGYTTTEGKSTRGFDEWLSNTDADLRDWWVSQDNFNYNFAGINKGTANLLLGRESTDDAYNPDDYISRVDINGFKDRSFHIDNDYYNEAITSLNHLYSIENMPESTSSGRAGASGVNAEANARYLHLYTYRQMLETAKEDVDISWNRYLTDVSDNIKELDNHLRETLGNKYEDYKTQNNKLYEDYEELMKKAKELKQTNVYNDKYVRNKYAYKLNDLYQKLVKQMKEFVDIENRKIGKTSSF